MRQVALRVVFLAAVVICGLASAAEDSNPSAQGIEPGDPYGCTADWLAFTREVDRAYPFFDLKGIRDIWAREKARLSDRVKTCASDPEFLAIVIEAILALRDAHMGLSGFKGSPPEFPRRHYPGLSFMPATQGRVVIMEAQAHADTLKPGTVITRIDGREARTTLEERAKQAWTSGGPWLVPFSSPQRARLFVYRWPLAGSSNETHTLHYLIGGREQELRVTCNAEIRGWPHTYHLPSLTPAGQRIAFALLPTGIGYVYVRSVNAETAPGLKKAFAAHPNARGWIIDLRGNSGGGYDSELLAQLKAMPRPVAAIIDAGCISAGETLARDLVQLADAHLMGSVTAGSSTSKRQWRFPSGIATVTFSTRSRWRSDGQPIEFNGISPHEEIEAVPEEVTRGANSEILRAEEYLLQLAKTE